jgi:hypothetical protein
LRLTAAARAALALLLGACASIGDPPGGPPDTTPPTVARLAPDSGSVVPPPHEAQVVLDEVIAERVAAPRPDISSAVLLSPVKGAVDVTWRRDRISVRPHEGFRAGRIYRLELLPVLVDLRQNRIKRGAISVFSTGPDIPSAVLAGTVVDWPGAKAGGAALIEAVLLHDSLAYRTLADSAGGFVLRQVPPGEYVVYGIIDQDNNHARGPREAFDTVRVHLGDSASVEVYAFSHDTTGPRLRTVEIVDSLTLRLTFDRPLDPAQAIDTAAVLFAAAADSTTSLGVLHVWTQAQLDSARAAAQAVRAAADSARARQRADSLRAHPPADSARARPRPPGQAAAPPAPVTAPPPLPAQQGAAPSPARPGQPARPADSTRAMRMLARRPPPTAVRVVGLAAPLTAGSRYVVKVSGVRDLSLVQADVRGQLAVPVPRPPARPARGRAPADSLRTPADTTRRAPPPPTPELPRDTTRVPPPGRPRTPGDAAR